jgi:hypothetical protein
VTDNEINVLIAEACGWKFHRRVTDTKSNVSWDVYAKDGKFASLMTESLPNYCSDLNAMHEAEKMLTLEEQNLYVVLLLKGGTGRGETQGCWHCLYSIARQRAEAFLRTISKWKDS